MFLNKKENYMLSIKLRPLMSLASEHQLQSFTLVHLLTADFCICSVLSDM